MSQPVNYTIFFTMPFPAEYVEMLHNLKTKHKMPGMIQFFYKGTAVGVAGDEAAKYLELLKKKDWKVEKSVSPSVLIKLLTALEAKLWESNGSMDSIGERGCAMYCMNVYFLVYVAKVLPNNDENGMVMYNC